MCPTFGPLITHPAKGNGRDLSRQLSVNPNVNTISTGVPCDLLLQLQDMRHHHPLGCDRKNLTMELPRMAKTEHDRRSFLSVTSSTLGILSLSPHLMGMSSAQPWVSFHQLKGGGSLAPADQNGIKLPPHLKSRIVAVSGEQVKRKDSTPSRYRWHRAPDGGACFAVADGGWVYTSNSEVRPRCFTL